MERLMRFDEFALPISNVTPFTYQDGLTFLEMLVRIREYIAEELVPAANKSNTQLAEHITEANVKLGAMVEQFNADLDNIDPDMVRDMITRLQTNLDAWRDAVNAANAQYRSETNAELDAFDVVLNGYAAQISEFKNSVNALFNQFKTDTNASVSGISSQLSTHTNASNTRFAAIESSITSNVSTLNTRITGLDNRFVLKDHSTPIAVFVGTSNVVPGTWPEILCADMGWTCKNFAVGGMGYTFDTNDNFNQQLTRARNDGSFANADVDYVFICDAANDARSHNGVSAAANTLFANARTWFPNARLIILPALISSQAPYDTTRNFKTVLSINNHDLRAIGAGYGAEFIDWSWTWHIDNLDYYVPSEVHYTSSGHRRTVYWIKEYLAGRSTKQNRGWREFNGYYAGWEAVVDPKYRPLGYSRDGNLITMQGFFRATANHTSGQNVIGRFPAAVAPNYDSTMILGTNHNSAGAVISLSFDLNAELSYWGPINPGDMISVNHTYPFI